MRNINKIIVHCSATPEGKNFSVADIRRWHLQRGFSDIGYHFVIYRDGSVNIGRPLQKSGAHCSGHNKNSIGVCYIGGVATDGKTPKDTRTSAQKDSLVRLITELRQQFPNASVHGHREFANKACPCFNASEEYKNL
ncbi:MAG: N-acetylmuramoyl-L-alanine amidase [Muribaculaceae bacterium]|nr:N-acetylmuramoyl-L-alanine amidase [Muribaculaceae bacterium]